jgi:hypothetical protein
MMREGSSLIKWAIDNKIWEPYDLKTFLEKVLLKGIKNDALGR